MPITRIEADPRAPLEQLIARWRKRARLMSVRGDDTPNMYYKGQYYAESASLRKCADEAEALALVLGPVQPQEKKEADDRRAD